MSQSVAGYRIRQGSTYSRLHYRAERLYEATSAVADPGAHPLSGNFSRNPGYGRGSGGLPALWVGHFLGGAAPRGILGRGGGRCAEIPSGETKISCAAAIFSTHSWASAGVERRTRASAIGPNSWC